MTIADFVESMSVSEAVVVLLAISGLVFVLAIALGKSKQSDLSSLDPKVKLRKLAEDVARAESEFKREITIQSQIEAKLKEAQSAAPFPAAGQETNQTNTQ